MTPCMSSLHSQQVDSFNLFRTFTDRVKDGVIKIKSAEFPAFIYSSAIQYDPQNRNRGLLRGEALLRVRADQSLWNQAGVTDNLH
jgi:hypothetical protein